MHESVGTPSTRTVQAPQCPSLQAIFVPVSPSSSRSVSASDVPTGTSTSKRPPLIVTLGSRRHRLDVGEVDQPEREPVRLPALAVVLDLRQLLPERARGLEQLADPVDLARAAVALEAGVDREPEHADGVGLPCPEERRAHREVLMDTRELHRLDDRVAPERLGRL